MKIKQIFKKMIVFMLVAGINLPVYAESAPESRQVVDEAAAKVVPSGKSERVNDIAIRVGNEIITSADIEIPLMQLELHLKNEIRGQELKEKLAIAREQHIQKLIEGKLLLLEARNQKIEIQDAMVKETAEKEVEKIKQQFPSEEAFRKQLATEHLNEYELIKQREKSGKENMLRQKLLQQKLREFRSGADVSDEKLKEYYDKNKDKFHSLSRAHVKQIFVQRPDTSLSAAEFAKRDEAARQKMARAYQEVRRGKMFDEVAKNYSEHKISADKGGDIGWIEEGNVGLPEFEKAVFKDTAPGNMSGILDTARGYFLVYVVDRQPGQTMPYEEVKGRIRQNFMAESSEERYEAWIESLKKKFKIKTVIDQ